ncbi:iron chelate uptake ABC transporter family permease subunit [Psychrobacter sp. HD31]|uniref:ABC transporter permease n=1 Tax=Psychrobacter sp. HD31 TaxID=3112003 RepID=UPI003DA55CD8
MHVNIQNPLILNLTSMIVMLVLVVISLSVGVADFSWSEILYGVNQDSLSLLLVSRLPRTLAIILAGASLAIAGTILQVVLRNRFVSPSMVGATQSSGLGLLLISLLFPASSLLLKMGVATFFAVLTMLLFMRLVDKLPPTQYLIVPLIGIVFGGIIDSMTVFIAYQTEMMQMLSVWQFGDFSAILSGRYEWLWITAVLIVLAYLLADQLTIVGLGDDIAINLGINKKFISRFAIGVVSMVSAVVVITVGSIPFVGLVVPNIVSHIIGDQLRRCLPAVAILGASALLLCDIIGRTIRFPYEVPVATVFGVVGAIIFLWLLLRK